MIWCVGEVVEDVYSNGGVLGGAPLHVAWHLSEAGVPVSLFTSVGNDLRGELIEKELLNFKFNLELSVVDSLPSGWVDIKVDAQGVPSFLIHKNTAWAQLYLGDEDEGQNCSGLVFGPLGMMSDHNRAELMRFRGLLRGKKVFMLADMNLRPHCYDEVLIDFCLSCATQAKVNEEELEVIAKLFGISGNYTDVLCNIQKKYELDAVWLTLGERGSVYYNNGVIEFEPAVKVEGLVDTVGAGDAFTAGICLGNFLKLTPRATLSRAGLWASEVCKLNGGLPEKVKLS